MVDEKDDKDNEQSAEGAMGDAVYAVRYQVTVHTIVSSTLLLLTLIALVVFILCLANGIQSVQMLVDLKPENRVELFSKKIDEALKSAEMQYNEHLKKMQDKSIFSVSDKFKLLYNASFESEQDNTALLSQYQQIIYQVASKTKGSGEWYQFYNDEIQTFIKKNKKRAIELKRYVHEPGADNN